MKKKLNFKIIIIGAGPAGCSCAIALSKIGIKDVIIIDNSKIGKFHIGESIPPNMNVLMKQLGIYKSFLAQNHEPCYGNCSYWGSELRGYNDSILSPYGHGWHLDRQEFNHLLVEEAQKRGALVLKGYTYKSADKIKTGYRIYIGSRSGNDDTLDADFIIDASGSRSVFAIEQESHKIQDTPLVCLCIRFRNKGGREVSKLTHIESVEYGWWYAAQIPGEHLLVTFYTTAKVVKKLGLHDLKNWVKLLQKAPNTHRWISGMEPVENKIMGFNSYSFCLNKVIGDSWLAVGDAASTYDPITSQGIMKSFSHGMRAAEIIAHHGKGTAEALQTFENEVKEQHAHYQDSRKYFYGLEHRWMNNEFWQEMQELKKNCKTKTTNKHLYNTAVIH